MDHGALAAGGSFSPFLAKSYYSTFLTVSCMYYEELKIQHVATFSSVTCDTLVYKYCVGGAINDFLKFEICTKFIH